MLTLTPMLWLMEDFVTSEDSILNIKNFSQTLSENSSEKCQTEKLIYLLHTLWLAWSSFWQESVFWEICHNKITESEQHLLNCKMQYPGVPLMNQNISNWYNAFLTSPFGVLKNKCKSFG